MSEFAWFKLLVRTAGIVLIGLALPALVRSVSVVGLLFSSNRATFGGFGDWGWMILGEIGGGVVQALLGCYLLFGAKGLIARCLAEIRGRCLSCGYDVSAVTNGPCPECGSPIHRPPGPGASPPAAVN